MVGVPVLMDGRQAWQMNLCFLPNMPETLAGGVGMSNSIFISTQFEDFQLQLLSF
jgi:hypothetical protein